MRFIRCYAFVMETQHVFFWPEKFLVLFLLSSLRIGIGRSSIFWSRLENSTIWKIEWLAQSQNTEKKSFEFGAPRDETTSLFHHIKRDGKLDAVNSGWISYLPSSVLIYFISFNLPHLFLLLFRLCEWAHALNFVRVVLAVHHSHILMMIMMMYCCNIKKIARYLTT